MGAFLIIWCPSSSPSVCQLICQHFTFLTAFLKPIPSFDKLLTGVKGRGHTPSILREAYYNGGGGREVSPFSYFYEPFFFFLLFTYRKETKIQSELVRNRSLKS